MENVPKVASMKRMSLREIWTDEASQFTPWLAENIHLLNEAIDARLEVQEQEKHIGSFRADIVANDLSTGETILIENQLQRTDHGHLGQLISYASGLQAVMIVWIASQFNDEHRAALDWLNQITTNGIRFFGLEIELWSVENSTPALRFNIVCKPNTWKKRISSLTTQEYKQTRNIDADEIAIHRLLERDKNLTHRKLASMTGASESTAYRIRKAWIAAHSTASSNLDETVREEDEETTAF